jgi:hypothetical protein
MLHKLLGRFEVDSMSLEEQEKSVLIVFYDEDRNSLKILVDEYGRGTNGDPD